MASWVLILSLATWRISALLYIEDAFRWLRKRLGIVELEGELIYPTNWIGDLWGCFWCLSLMTAFILSTVTAIVDKMGIWSWFVLWLSSAAGALWIEKRIGAVRR